MEFGAIDSNIQSVINDSHEDIGKLFLKAVDNYYSNRNSEEK